VLALIVAACGAAAPLPSAGGPTPSLGQSSAPTPHSTEEATSRPVPTPWPLSAGQIVFEHHQPGADRHEVWIADGSGARRIERSDWDDARPSFSPDGMTILFTRYGADPDQAYFMSLDGANLQPLDCPALCDPEGDAWSPDGRTLAIDRAFGFTNASGRFDIRNVSIWVVNVDGTGLHEVTHNGLASRREDHRPAWSPDGKRIAFARTDSTLDPPRTAIFAIAVDGTGLRQVTPWDLDANEPDWSPDGSRIAFSSPAAALQPGREQNLFTIRPDGSGLQQLTAHLEAGEDGAQGTFDPSWSPDGSQLIFTHIPSFGGWADLYIVNADGTDLHVLARTPDLNESHAVWGVSPGS
jgi:Tol biopolymer transport system component